MITTRSSVTFNTSHDNYRAKMSRENKHANISRENRTVEFVTKTDRDAVSRGETAGPAAPLRARHGVAASRPDLDAHDVKEQAFGERA